MPAETPAERLIAFTPPRLNFCQICGRWPTCGHDERRHRQHEIEQAKRAALDAAQEMK